MTEQGATVDVVMTEAATHFITPVTMQALSGRPVFVDAWDARVPNNMAHIDLTRGADAVLIAPASADFMALAHGMADDLLSTLCLARACPLLVAPAMNREMGQPGHPAQRRTAARRRHCRARPRRRRTGLRRDRRRPHAGSARAADRPDRLLPAQVAGRPPRAADRRPHVRAGRPHPRAEQPLVRQDRLRAARAREAGARVTLVTGATALPCRAASPRCP